MEIRNHTPFMPLMFQSQDVDDRRFHVLVLKGTYEISNGQPLKLPTSSSHVNANVTPNAGATFNSDSARSTSSLRWFNGGSVIPRLSGFV